MHKGREIRLPDGPMGFFRHAEIGFTHHGDLQFDFWVGERDHDTEADMAIPKGISFPMAHSSETVVLAAMIGYYRRLGKTTEEIREEFHQSANEVMQDPVVINDAPLRDNYRAMYLADLVEGQSMPVYDMPYYGWDSLTYPVPCQPGVIESVGGIGLFSRTDILGNFTFVMAILPGRQYGLPTADEERPMSIELDSSDIPLVAEALCSNSMGEYRRDVYNLIYSL